jgi:hypothetical protein
VKNFDQSSKAKERKRRKRRTERQKPPFPTLNGLNKAPDELVVALPHREAFRVDHKKGNLDIEGDLLVSALASGRSGVGLASRGRGERVESGRRGGSGRDGLEPRVEGDTASEGKGGGTSAKGIDLRKEHVRWRKRAEYGGGKRTVVAPPKE